MTRRSDRRKRWLTNALVIGIIAVLALIAAQLIRLSHGGGVADLTEHGRKMDLFTAANQQDVEVTIPGRPHHLPGLMHGSRRVRPLVSYTFSTNSHGLRGPEFEVPRNPGTYRILCAGECVTFGNGVDDDEIWTARLQALLDEREGPGHYEVINAGTVGTPPHLLVEALKQRWMAFSPDLVVFSPGSASPLDAAHNGVEPFRLWLSSSEYDQFQGEYHQALQEAQDTVTAAGAKLVLVTPTCSSFFLPDGTHWVRWMTGWARRHGVPCLDTTTSFRAQEEAEGMVLEVDGSTQRLVQTSGGRRKVLYEAQADHAQSEGYVAPALLEYLARHPRKRQRLFIDDNHPTPEGHQLLAEELLAMLDAQQLLPLARDVDIETE